MTLDESIELERLKHTLQCELERQKASYSQAVPAMVGAFTYATETIKALILINGGGVLALLSFFGTLIPRYSRVGGSQFGDLIEGLGKPLTYYLLGVGCAALAFGTSYISQIFFNENILKNLTLSHNRANSARVLALAFAATSIAMFALGSYWSAEVLKSLAMLPVSS